MSIGHLLPFSSTVLFLFVYFLNQIVLSSRREALSLRSAGVYSTICQLGLRWNKNRSLVDIWKRFGNFFFSWEGRLQEMRVITWWAPNGNFFLLGSSEIENIEEPPSRAEKNAVVYSCCPEPYPFVDIHISIERRPMFYVSLSFPLQIHLPGLQSDPSLCSDKWNRSPRFLYAIWFGRESHLGNYFAPLDDGVPHAGRRRNAAHLGSPPPNWNLLRGDHIHCLSGHGNDCIHGSVSSIFVKYWDF